MPPRKKIIKEEEQVNVPVIEEVKAEAPKPKITEIEIILEKGRMKGFRRKYSLAMHGENFLQLAAEFKKNKESK